MPSISKSRETDIDNSYKKTERIYTFKRIKNLIWRIWTKCWCGYFCNEMWREWINSNELASGIVLLKQSQNHQHNKMENGSFETAK